MDSATRSCQSGTGTVVRKCVQVVNGSAAATKRKKFVMTDEVEKLKALLEENIRKHPYATSKADREQLQDIVNQEKAERNRNRNRDEVMW